MVAERAAIPALTVRHPRKSQLLSINRPVDFCCYESPLIRTWPQNASVTADYPICQWPIVHMGAQHSYATPIDQQELTLHDCLIASSSSRSSADPGVGRARGYARSGIQITWFGMTSGSHLGDRAGLRRITESDFRCSGRQVQLAPCFMHAMAARLLPRPSRRSP